jgi:hypothetical protein
MLHALIFRIQHLTRDPIYMLILRMYGGCLPKANGRSIFVMAMQFVPFVVRISFLNYSDKCYIS